MTDGTDIHYGQLCICTGGKPKVRGKYKPHHMKTCLWVFRLSYTNQAEQPQKLVRDLKFWM